MRAFSTLLGLVIAGFVAVPALAQPADCNAVLANGTFKFEQLSNNSYFQQVLYSRFIESTYESSQSDRGLGIEIPLGEAVMGKANYSQADYDAKKKSIDDTRFQRITQSNYTQSVVSSGDGPVLEAWTNCITRGGGGLWIRFVPLTATKLLLDMRWLPQGRTHRTKLSQHVLLPGVTVTNVSNPSCFRRNTWIVQGVGCRTTFDVPDAWTPVAITVQARDGTQDAFIPARIKMENGRESLAVPDLYKEFKRKGVITTSASFELPASLKAEGWVIDPGSVKGRVSKEFDNGSSGTNYCSKAEWSAQLSTINYSFASRSATRGHDGWTIGCRMKVQGERIRSRWVADEINKPVPLVEPGSDKAAP